MKQKLNNIIADYYRKGFFIKLLSPFNANGTVQDIDKEDFIQELILILLEYKNTQLLIDMYERKTDKGCELDRFILCIIKRQVATGDSSFYRLIQRWTQTRESIVFEGEAYGMDAEYNYYFGDDEN